jgi:hypothetical protein
VVFCNLSPLQLRVYERLIASEDFQVLVRHKEECDCGRGSHSSTFQLNLSASCGTRGV